MFQLTRVVVELQLTTVVVLVLIELAEMPPSEWVEEPLLVESQPQLPMNDQQGLILLGWTGPDEARLQRQEGWIIRLMSDLVQTLSALMVVPRLQHCQAPLKLAPHSQKLSSPLSPHVDLDVHSSIAFSLKPFSHSASWSYDLCFSSHSSSHSHNRSLFQSSSTYVDSTLHFSHYASHSFCL